MNTKIKTALCGIATAVCLIGFTATRASAQPLPAPTIEKAFGSGTVATNQSTSVTITISNPNATPLTGVAFSDTLPAGLLFATPSALAQTCGGVAVAATGPPAVLSLSAGALAGNGSCTVTANVTAAAAGSYVNVTGNVTSTESGPGLTATATLLVLAPPTITKAFGLPAIDINQVTTLTLTIANPNAATILNGVAVSDTLPAGLRVASPVGAASTCGGTLTAAAGATSVSLTGVTLAANTSCIITVNVVGFSDGPFTNTTGAVTATETGDGLTASAPITVNPIIDGEAIYQLRYLANLNQGDSYVNLTNAGTLNGFDPAGRICVNVYTFDPAEELISCCACPVTPNGLNSLSARNDLISNTLTPGVPTSITVKLLATVPGAGGSCNASTPTAQTVVRGMRSWASTLHLNTSGSPAVGYQATETPFSRTELSVTELQKLTSYCGFIQANGSGFGICKSCRAGALGAEQK